jgi:hypothetical protein
LGSIVRLGARLVIPLESLKDEARVDFQSLNWERQPSESPILLYGASAGLLAVGTRSFVLAPGLTFLRSDVSDYGSFVGLGVPFEWTTGSAIRIGLDLALGRVFGGSIREICSLFNTQSCVEGETREVDRPGGTGFYIHFQLGYGFNHPSG